MLAGVRDAVRYRDLLRNLVVRDLKVRYRNSFLGIVWSLLNPLLMMLVYVFVFTQLLRDQTPPPPPQLIVDNWRAQFESESGGQIMLDGGMQYNLRLEYFDELDGAAIGLYWQPPGGAKELVPPSALYPSSAPTTTHGLTADYFNNPDLTSLRVTRLDPAPDFDWDRDSPVPDIIEPDSFSVRWTGVIRTPEDKSGLYTFFTLSDDGARLWVDNGRPSPNAPAGEVYTWTINTYFPVFILIALLPWNWFAGSVLGSTRSIVDNAHLIKKVYFPRELLPFSLVISNLVNFLLALPVLFGLILLMKPTITLQYLWLPVILLTQTVFLAGLAFFLSAVNVYFRDTYVILDVVIVAWFFLTPIFYDIKQVWPEWADWIYRLNPMASLISNYRDILFWGAPPDPAFVLRTFLTAVLVFLLGYLVFARTSRSFGELL